LDLVGGVAEARATRRRYMWRFQLPRQLAALLFIAALTAVNVWWFAAVGSDYFGWYLANGATVALAFAVVAVAVDFDSHPGLIAADPANFSVEILLVFIDLVSALKATSADTDPDFVLYGGRAETVQSKDRFVLVDLFFNLLFDIALAVGLLAWALVVAAL
jgi:hypothetical protein